MASLKWALLTGVAIGLGLQALPVQAVEHDGCAGGVDASDTWNGAFNLNLPTNCEGEMLINGDQDDWYSINVPATQGLTANLNAQVCPGATKIGPWNMDLNVYFQELGGAGGSGVNLIIINIQGVTLVPGPGDLMGSSANAAGCDTVTASVTTTGANIGALGRWYVDVHRTTGDGFYTLTLN